MANLCYFPYSKDLNMEPVVSFQKTNISKPPPMNCFKSMNSTLFKHHAGNTKMNVQTFILSFKSP